MLQVRPLGVSVGVAQLTSRRRVRAAPRTSGTAIQITVDLAIWPLRGRPSLRGLTDREQEVGIQVARGLSSAEIAQQLYLSEATVTRRMSPDC